MSKPSRRKRLGRKLVPRRRRSWEAVWQGDMEATASIVAGGLDANGIPARIQGSDAIRSYVGMWLPGGAWAVIVPSSEAEHARDLLRERGEEAGVVEGGGTMDFNETFDLGTKIMLSFVGIILLVLAYSALARLMAN
jgi:hypothetical protein